MFLLDPEDADPASTPPPSGRRTVITWWGVCFAAWIALFCVRTPLFAISVYLLANLSVVGLMLHVILHRRASD